MKIQDINLEDKSIRETYYSNFAQGNYAECIRILQENPQLEGKVSVAELYNVLSGSNEAGIYSLSNLQKNYKDSESRMQDSIEVQDEKIEDFAYLGAWVQGAHYHPLNCVSYNNLSYLSISDFVSSTTPDQDNNFVEMNINGMRGQFGINLKIKYYWAIQRPYNINDLIYYNNSLWVAKQNHFSNPANMPTDGSSYWWKFLETESTKLLIQEAPPSTPSIGTIWLSIE